MKSPDLEMQTTLMQQCNETAAEDLRASKKRGIVATGVTLLGVTASACGVSHSTASPKLPVRPTPVIRPYMPPTTLEAPTTTTTTVSPEIKYKSGTPVGAIQLLRENADEQGSPDVDVVHQLNNGIWYSSSRGMSVDPNPMLKYGAVLNQNTAPIGTYGETTVIAFHDVTPNYASVILNGITYSQRENMASTTSGSVATNPSAGIGNMQDGDLVKLDVNEPNNKVKVFTYMINNRYLMNPNLDADWQALSDPPPSGTTAELRIYDCWPQTTETDREVLEADLLYTETLTGQATYSGSEPPVNTPDQ